MTVLTWYGVSAVQIKTKGVNIVVDPYLTKSPLGAVDLHGVEADLILVTHGANDHFGDAVALQKLTNAMLVAPVDVVTCAREKGVPAERTRTMVPGATRTICGIDIKALHVQHISFTRCGPELGDKVYTGVALSYMITLEEGLKLYHCGDSALHGDFRLFGDIYQPDLAFMPIGKFNGAVTEMDPFESAIATDWLGVSHVIPVHYDTIEQKDYVEWFARELAQKERKIEMVPLISSTPYNLTLKNSQINIKKG